MDKLVLKQNRYALTGTDGLLSFRIDIACSVLRDTGSQVTLAPEVFVYSTDTDLVADVSSGGSIDGNFLRVATISDLGSLPTSLAGALSTGKSEYRDSNLQLSMPDLETAVNAVPVVVDRVNALVKDYIEYQNNFFSNLEDTYSLPLTTDSSLVEGYTSAYTAAVDSRKAAETELEATQLEYAQLKAKSDLLIAYKNELEDFYESLVAYTQPVYDVASNYLNDPNFSGASTVQQTQFGVTSSKNLLRALATNRGAILSSLQAQESIVQSQLKNKEQELALLEDAEASALTDLATYCPQVDPNTLG